MSRAPLKRSWAILAFLVTGLSCQHTCERRQEPGWATLSHTWPQVPISVTDDGTFRGTLKDAIKFWNDQVGCRIFEYVPDEVTAEVVVSPGEPPAGTDAARHCPDYGACTAMALAPVPTAYVYYVTPSTIDVDFCVLMHELGHAVGLADDLGYRMSVMGSCKERGPVLLVTDNDKRLLRERYCPDR